MRPSCLECVMKHLAQACILVSESKLGYPHHFAYAIGHLGEAECESLHDYPGLAQRIREFRKKLLEGTDETFDELIFDVWELWKNG